MYTPMSQTDIYMGCPEDIIFLVIALSATLDRQQ